MEEGCLSKNRLPVILGCDMAALYLKKNSIILSVLYVYESAYLVKKENQVRMAIKTRFTFPKSWSLQDSKDILSPLDVYFPCFIKLLGSCVWAKADKKRTRKKMNRDDTQNKYYSSSLLSEIIR